MAFEKKQRPLFTRFGQRTHVTNDTATMVNHSHTHIDSTGVYTLDAPSVGIVKTISLVGNDTAHAAGAFTIQTNSSSVTFAGTTFDSIKNTTDLNTGTNARPTGIALVGLSTTQWAISSLSFSTNVTISATTRA